MRVDRIVHAASIVAIALAIAFAGAPAVARPMSPLRNLTFLFILPKATVVTIEIYDADGNKVATPIAERRYEAGEHKEEIDLSSFIAGSYMIRITTPERTENQRFELQPQ